MESLLHQRCNHLFGNDYYESAALYCGNFLILQGAAFAIFLFEATQSQEVRGWL